MKWFALLGFLIFIGVSIVPSINALEDTYEFVEFNVEYCGLNKQHTIMLSQEDAEEVDLLFDTIKMQLSLVESKKEAKVIR